MQGFAFGAIMDLMPAACSGGCDEDVIRELADSGEEHEFSDFHRNVVMFGLIPE